jgi:hypothetical protein
MTTGLVFVPHVSNSRTIISRRWIGRHQMDFRYRSAILHHYLAHDRRRLCLIRME